MPDDRWRRNGIMFNMASANEKFRLCSTCGALICLLILSLTSGCNSYKVTALPYDANLKGVVVVDNPKVRDGHFVPVLEKAFNERGFRVRHGTAADAAGDEAVVTYSALRSWDIVPYLADADVVISKNGVQKASGHYHHTGGSLSLDVFTKWRGDGYKMADLYNELLVNFAKRGK